MTEKNSNLDDNCQKALELQTLLLLNELVSAPDREFLSSHVSQCSSCREMTVGMTAASQALQTSYSSITVSTGFSARTMAALAAAPAQPVLAKTNSARPQVFAAAPQRRSLSWALMGAAAVLAFGAMVVLFSAPKINTSGQANSVVVRKGKLLDADGNSVSSLTAGAVYRVVEDAVVPLNEHSTIKVQKGAQFALQSTDSEPELKLQAGDLYAWGRENGKVTRIQCSDFRTLLRNGDFFVAHETGEQTAGIVIVFNGNAEITDQDETMALRAGQVFVRMGTDDLAVSQVLEMSDAVVRIVENNSPVIPDMAAMRHEYETRVQGYRRELETLKTRVQTEQDALRLAELRERQQRVTAYYEAHKRRLESLKHERPFESIRRGLNGHSDPSTWL